MDDRSENSRKVSNLPLLTALNGDWYIVYSNFPMWTKGARQYPMFHYSVGTRDGVEGLIDTVTYVSGDTKKDISGFDTPKNEARFVWRGDGWLTKWLTSEWRVVEIDPEDGWALIQFEKTLFTPAGYDVITRNHQLHDAQAKKIDDLLTRHGVGAMTKISQKSV